MIWDKWYDPSIGANGKSSISTGITETLAFDLAFDLAFELEFETLESRALLLDWAVCVRVLIESSFMLESTVDIVR